MVFFSAQETKLSGCRLFFFILLPVLLLFICLSPSLAGASAEEELKLTILHTNDEHGALIPHSPAVDFHPQRENPTVGGYARLATAVTQIRQDKERSGEPVMLLSGGDFIGGTAYSWLVPMGYAPELSIKQMIGYDAVTIGNHEYDYGPDILAGYLSEAGYPEAHDQTAVLASNTKAPPEHPLARNGLYLQSRIMDLENGLKVGLFGLIGENAVSVTTANEPVEFSDQHEAARQMVRQLQQEGAQLIIALTHSGVDEDRALAADVPGIDVIIGGHCHTVLHEPVIENGTIIVQAGTNLEYIGRLELAFKPSSGEVRIRNEENRVPYLQALDHTFEPDPDVAALIDQYTGLLDELVWEMTGGRFQHILDPLALSAFKIPDDPPLQESPFGNFVTDALRLVTAAKSEHDPDFALLANGSIRGSLNPGTMPHSFGKVAFYDLVKLIGLGMGPDGYAGYPVVAAYLTGDEILRLLEVAVLLQETMGNTYFLQFSGLRYHFNPQNAILFTVPILDLPVPSTRAVTRAELYIGEGRQTFDDDQYLPLERGDEQLYCVVTDWYNVSFLPMIGELLPQLEIVLKDRDGNPVDVDNLEQLIVHVDGRELKVWQTVAEYAAGQPVGDSGLPEVKPYYAATAQRINLVRTIPLITWPLLILVALTLGTTGLVRRRKRKKRRPDH